MKTCFCILLFVVSVCSLDAAPQYQIDMTLVQIPGKQKSDLPALEVALKKATWHQEFTSLVFEGESVTIGIQLPEVKQKRGAREPAKPDMSEWAPFNEDIVAADPSSSHASAKLILVVVGEKGGGLLVEGNYLATDPRATANAGARVNRRSSFSHIFSPGRWMPAPQLDSIVDKDRLAWVWPVSKANTLILYLRISPAAISLN